jgi:hypothetical protein
VLEVAQIVGGTVRDNSGNFQEAKDKRFGAPEGLTISMIAVTDALYMRPDPDMSAGENT